MVSCFIYQFVFYSFLVEIDMYYPRILSKDVVNSNAQYLSGSPLKHENRKTLNDLLGFSAVA